MTTRSSIVLIGPVEQHSDMNELAALIGRHDADVLTASSAAGALELVQANDIAVVLLVVQAPYDNSMELAQRLRDGRPAGDLPVIFLTLSTIDAESRALAYRAGAADVLILPADTDALRSKIELFIRIDQQRKQAVDQFHRLQNSLRLNDRFLSLLGHDVRNPLSVMISGSAVLLTVSADATIAATAARLQTSARRMAKLIDQMLDFVRLRSGQAILNRQSGNYLQLCKQMVDDLPDRESAKHVSIEATGDMQGVFDAARLSQLLASLLGITFQHGAVNLPVTIALDGTDARTVTITVANAGIMPADLIAGLFTSLQNTPEMKSPEAGSDVGMYIVERLVDAHGGSITASSTESDGTVFSVRLPRQPGLPVA